MHRNLRQGPRGNGGERDAGDGARASKMDKVDSRIPQARAPRMRWLLRFGR